MNTALAPAPSSWTDFLTCSTFNGWWHRTQMPSGISRVASIDVEGVDSDISEATSRRIARLTRSGSIGQHVSDIQGRIKY